MLLYVHSNRRFIRNGSPGRTSTSTFTQLLSSDPKYPRICGHIQTRVNQAEWDKTERVPAHPRSRNTSQTLFPLLACRGAGHLPFTGQEKKTELPHRLLTLHSLGTYVCRTRGGHVWYQYNRIIVFVRCRVRVPPWSVHVVSSIVRTPHGCVRAERIQHGWVHASARVLLGMVTLCTNTHT